MARARTQSSIAVTADDRHWVIVNASPDLRQQINENPLLHPREGKRHSPIVSVVLTNGDVDHLAGLLTLRESHPLSVYGTRRILAVLETNSIFNVLNPAFVDRRRMEFGVSFDVADKSGNGTGVVMEAFAVPGKVALYGENAAAGPDFGTEPEDTAGLKIGTIDGDRHFFYVPGCAHMTEALAERLRGAPLVLFDGTLWRDDEMIRAGVGTKTGRRMAHMSMADPDGTIAAFKSLGVRRKIFVHINNTNPVLLEDSPERAAMEAAGWEAAVDGMEIRL